MTVQQEGMIPLAWTIDVCRMCGRIAQWPGCEPWQRSANWTVTVTVHPSPAEPRRLADVMEAALKEASA